MPMTKYRRLSDGNEGLVDDSASTSSLEVIDKPPEENESSGTEDEIADAQSHTKSKKTQKRKRRATSPSQFGSTLQSLLCTDAPSNHPLSLKPSVSKKRTDVILEVKARRLLEDEKKEKEEKNHITDVIGGWGGESERSLRKVAQRGVVKLFNAIQQTQAAVASVQEEAKAARGSGKPTLPAPIIDSKMKKVDCALGDFESLPQDRFLQMIKLGGMVAKT